MAPNLSPRADPNPYAWERSTRAIESTEAPKAIDLATAGAQALTVTHRTNVGDRPATALTAVLALDDKIWIVTWTSFGDEAAVAADKLASEGLLRGVQLAIL